MCGIKRLLFLKNISVVIPVYNERESLAELLERIVNACQIYHLHEIICVDDGSTDGSFEILQDLKKLYP